MRNGLFNLLRHEAAIRSFQRQPGIGVSHDLLDLLLVGGWRDDGNALFSAVYMALELFLPFAIPGNQCGVRSLHIDQHLVVDGIAMKTRHGSKVLTVLVAGEKLLNAALNVGGDLLQAFLRGLSWRLGRRRCGRWIGHLIVSEFRHEGLLSASG